VYPFLVKFPDHQVVEIIFNITLVVMGLNALQESHEVAGFALYLKFKNCNMKKTFVDFSLHNSRMSIFPFFSVQKVCSGLW